MSSRKLLLLCTLCWPLPALAADGLGIARAGFGLIVIAALLWGLAWLSRRVPATLGSALQIRATLPLGQRSRLMVVAVGDQQWLVSQTPQQIQLLSPLDQPLPETAVKPLDFAHWMQALKKGQPS